MTQLAEIQRRRYQNDTALGAVSLIAIALAEPPSCATTRVKLGARIVREIEVAVSIGACSFHAATKLRAEVRGERPLGAPSLCEQVSKPRVIVARIVGYPEGIQDGNRMSRSRQVFGWCG